MRLLSTIFGLFLTISIFAQTTKPDINKSSDWETHNRNTVIVSESIEKYFIRFDAKEGDGLSIFKNLEFENGTIELEIKGKNNPGKSFVGIAFHIQDEETFNAVYFRPFNFKNPDKTRSGHSVQYISHPEFTWRKLRNDFPEQFENPVNPVPDPDEYFHAIVIVKWPLVTVYVNDSTEPSLKVKMKSKFQKGKVGFWVGHGSDGEFKNLTITSN